MLGRVVSSFRVLGTGMLPLGGLIGGLVAAHWSLQGPLWLASGVLAISTIAARPLLGGAFKAEAGHPR
jgi:hypothetical protein